MSTLQEWVLAIRSNLGFVNVIRFLSIFLLMVSAGADSQTQADAPAKRTVDGQASTPAIMQPEELAAILQKGGPRPLLIQVGFHVLYQQAHIPGSEYIGPGSSAEALQKLRSRVSSLPHKTAIVLYCGCCPWAHCPNVHPAYLELRSLGFTNVKVLYIAQNFGDDWVNKGYPVEKGE